MENESDPRKKQAGSVSSSAALAVCLRRTTEAVSLSSTSAVKLKQQFVEVIRWILPAIGDADSPASGDLTDASWQVAPLAESDASV